MSVSARLAQPDYVGAGLLIPSLTCLFLALQFGGNNYSWGSGLVVGLFVACGVLLVEFAALQEPRHRAAAHSQVAHCGRQLVCLAFFCGWRCMWWVYNFHKLEKHEYKKKQLILTT